MIKLDIPTSKSITNRALIIDALTGNKCHIHNLSTSRDSLIMQGLLASDEEVLNVQDAGTVMRFLTAYLAVTGQKKTLHGTDRMHERPIKILVRALRSIGAKIDYSEHEGFPPIRIKGFTPLKAHLKLAIDGSVSSQYISALLMIAPVLNDGLVLILTGKIGSRPYIQMTLDLMEHFGIQYTWDANTITIPGKPYIPNQLTIEPDWSSASYWYSFVSISRSKKLLLKGYRSESLQGDSVLVNLYSKLGVATEFTPEGMILSATDHIAPVQNIDFSDCPDIAQTILVTSAYHRVNLTLTGLESLRIKETDRILAMQNELSKIGATLSEITDGTFSLSADSLFIPDTLSINTYHDHRMAMAFAPLCTVCRVEFDDKSVVDKSYPTYWSDLRKAT